MGRAEAEAGRRRIHCEEKVSSESASNLGVEPTSMIMTCCQGSKRGVSDFLPGFRTGGSSAGPLGHNLGIHPGDRSIRREK